LVLLRCALQLPLSPAVVAPHAAKLSSLVLVGVNDAYFRVSAEALRAAAALVPTVDVGITATVSDKAQAGAQRKALALDLYKAVSGKMALADVDQDVKEAAIASMGALVSALGDALTSELPACLRLLSDRLSNEITRQHAVAAIAQIAASPLHVDLNVSDRCGVASLTCAHMSRTARASRRDERARVAAASGQPAAATGRAHCAHCTRDVLRPREGVNQPVGYA
jgi:hypothetical protein